MSKLERLGIATQEPLGEGIDQEIDHVAQGIDQLVVDDHGFLGQFARFIADVYWRRLADDRAGVDLFSDMVSCPNRRLDAALHQVVVGRQASAVVMS